MKSKKTYKYKLRGDKERRPNMSDIEEELGLIVCEICPEDDVKGLCFEKCPKFQKDYIAKLLALFKRYTLEKEQNRNYCEICEWYILKDCSVKEMKPPCWEPEEEPDD